MKIVEGQELVIQSVLYQPSENEIYSTLVEQISMTEGKRHLYIHKMRQNFKLEKPWRIFHIYGL